MYVHMCKFPNAYVSCAYTSVYESCVYTYLREVALFHNPVSLIYHQELKPSTICMYSIQVK